MQLKRLSQIVSILCLVAMFHASPAVPAQTPGPSPSPTPVPRVVDKPALHQALLDLSNLFTVMCVAAHPDDEDGTTLTVLRRKYGVHTVSLFSTFGEGGQNAVGPELYEELGVIRARETLAASRIQGSEPFFLGLKDFGYSKSLEEAFKVWGHEEALRRLVLKIRELRPDVIITNHNTSRGHGHHQATGHLLLESFAAAADPKRFPEQLTKVKPWQVQRLFVRVSGVANPGEQTSPQEKFVSVDPNEVDSVRGTSFAQQALTALQQHATQGPWPKTIEDLLRARRIEGGKLPPIRYRLVGEAANVPALPDSSIPFVGGLKAPAWLPKITAFENDPRPLTEYLDQPGVVLETLIESRRSSPTAASSHDPHRIQLMADRFNHALALAAGVSLSISSSEPVLIPGKQTTFSLTLANAGDREITIHGISFGSGSESQPLSSADQLLPDTETVITKQSEIAFGQLTVPKPEHLYDGLVFGRPFQAVAELEIDGARFKVGSQMNIEVAPAIEIKDVSPSPYLLTPATLNKPLAFKATITNNLTTPAEADVVFRRANIGGAEVGPELSLEPGETREMSVKSNIIPVDTPTERRIPRPGFGVVGLEIQAKDRSTPAVMRGVPAIYVDARTTPGLRVGYVPSFDQTLERSLSTLGVEASQLSVENIQKEDLSVYDTIVIDNRGYEAHPELIAANSRLLEFANSGGTLIVFYHKANEWNPNPQRNRPQLAPYPITLSDDRVTDETAPIRFLAPRHQLLNFPNRIRQADFKNWIQERGLYYPKEWDKRYTSLFSANDPGEKPLTGGLLVAQYGKGQYIHSSMVWYRQLRAGVPGAYRVFANMISFGGRRPAAVRP